MLLVVPIRSALWLVSALRVHAYLRFNHAERDSSLAQIASSESPEERALALFGGAVGECVGHHIALRFHLDPVIADSGGGVHGLFHIPFFQDPLGLLRIVGPDAGEKVRLQLQLHQVAIILGFTNPPAQALQLR